MDNLHNTDTDTDTGNIDMGSMDMDDNHIMLYLINFQLSYLKKELQKTQISCQISCQTFCQIFGQIFCHIHYRQMVIPNVSPPLTYFMKERICDTGVTPILFLVRSCVQQASPMYEPLHLFHLLDLNHKRH